MRARLLAPALAGSALLAYFAAELYVIGRPGFPLDDAWIHLQFAARLGAADGLAYNPGQLVTGSSSPLWTALLSLAFLLAAPFGILWSKFLGAVFFLLAVFGCDRLAQELGLNRTSRLLAGLMVASTHWLLWAALSGMEVTLFTALSLWGLIFHIREKRRGSGFLGTIVIALACLARPEGLLLLGLALADRLLQYRPATDESAPTVLLRRDPDGLKPWLATAVLVVPIALFYFSISGSPAPSTLAAKTRPDLLPNGAYLRLVVDIFWRSQPILTLLALAGVIRGLRRSQTGGGLVAVWLLALPFAYSFLAAPGWPMPLGNFGRYYLPMIPLVVIFGLLALEPLLDELKNGLKLLGLPALLPARGLIIAALLLPQVLTLGAGPARHVQTVANVEDSDVRAAFWLRERLPADALLAVQDVGALKFYLPNHVIDLAGLVSPEIIPILRQDDGVYWEQHLLQFLAEKRPDYLVVFSASYPMLTSSSQFRRVASFDIENNVTMAGDELVILETPWSDQPLDPPP